MSDTFLLLFWKGEMSSSNIPRNQELSGESLEIVKRTILFHFWKTSADEGSLPFPPNPLMLPVKALCPINLHSLMLPVKALWPINLHSLIFSVKVLCLMHSPYFDFFSLVSNIIYILWCFQSCLQYNLHTLMFPVLCPIQSPFLMFSVLCPI